jgi:2-oxoglutarate/2-oxoacid ferredoxin oxidoreductase subunit beta
VRAAYRHKGLSFLRIVQRCPEWLPEMWDPWLHDPQRLLLLTHERGLQPSEGLARVYRNQLQHDPAQLNRAREIASDTERIPVGILYHDPEVPCYETLRASAHPRSAEYIRAGLERELDKFTVWPQ